MVSARADQIGARIGFASAEALRDGKVFATAKGVFAIHRRSRENQQV
jgi:hypothetical protein